MEPRPCPSDTFRWPSPPSTISLGDGPRDDLPSDESKENPEVTEMLEEEVPPITLYVPGDALPSHGGAGTVEILEITRLLEAAGVCCCVVGISALRYFGAWRARHDWEICVPTHLVESASQIFQSEPYNKIYEINPGGRPQLDPLLQPFPRFKIKGVDLYFTIITAELAHLECVSSNLERSQMGIPYPKLEVFAQSLLETNDEVALADLIDGMNLTNEWGLENLDLHGTHDISWVKKQNEKISRTLPKIDFACLLELDASEEKEGIYQAGMHKENKEITSPSVPETDNNSCLHECPITYLSKEEVWKNIVNTKERRLGIECPTEVFATRFYPRKNGWDPRLKHGNFA
ncbi:hypothetical protein PRK78_000594 [Emydomyces testavorans]|uniref:Uncharacterized protein n=1 Tax=Emydomyces testavorans TaxID=2070801 RepID=A0AAF0IEL5_9EURO|nr:hypothetical protein PRK78_000594 [Emydomyces testavorans]